MPDYRQFRLIRMMIGAAVVCWAAAELAYAPRLYGAEWPYTDFDKRIVALSGIQSGGPPNDGIPPVDEPRFETPAGASRWIHLREPVVVLTMNGETRAYPLQVLTWHEIVSDKSGGAPVQADSRLLALRLPLGPPSNPERKRR